MQPGSAAPVLGVLGVLVLRCSGAGLVACLGHNGLPLLGVARRAADWGRGRARSDALRRSGPALECARAE
eukprot:9301129-Alexandrium_andersonii.AAC.1